MLSLAVVALYLGWQALDSAPIVGDLRFMAFSALPGALHAALVVISLKRKATVVRAVFFITLAGLLNCVTPFSGFFASPIFPAVPAIVRLIPQLRHIGDSTPGDSVRILFFVLCASASGSLAYWLLVRSLWLRSLRRRDLWRTMGLCTTATLLVFVGLAVFRSTPARFNSTRNVAEILPTVLWWFAFSTSLFWSESSLENYQTAVAQPT
jgi:hypothetical protein